MDTFSERIKRLRGERKLTANQVASSIGVSVSTYRDWEYGREVKGEKAYIKIAKFYGVSLSYLIQGNEEAHLYQELQKTQTIIKECLEHVNNIMTKL